jgi:hypothetical protein
VSLSISKFSWGFTTHPLSSNSIDDDDDDDDDDDNNNNNNERAATYGGSGVLLEVIMGRESKTQ